MLKTTSEDSRSREACKLAILSVYLVGEDVYTPVIFAEGVETHMYLNILSVLLEGQCQKSILFVKQLNSINCES